MTPAAVRAVSVPHGSLAARTFRGVHYADAYAVDLPPLVSARTFAEAVFASAPRWVAGLMTLRNGIVRPLGLIATRSALGRAVANDGGAHIGIFPVLAEAGDEVVLGVIATFVRFHGLLGRAYFVPVRPAHRLIVPAMLRDGARRLAAAER